MTQKNVIYTFLVSILIISIINIFFFFLLVNKFPNAIDEYNNIIIKNLTFFFGPLLDNFINKNEYYFNFGYHDLSFKYYLGRMPFIPFFIKFTYIIISKKFLIILLFKNIFFFSLIILIIQRKIKNFYLFFIFLFLLIYNPHNIFTLTSLIPEEGYIGYLLVIIYLLTTQFSNRTSIIFLSIFLSFVYLTKASMTYFCYTFSIYLFFLYKKKINYKYAVLPIFFLLLSYISWSTFGYIKLNKIINPLSVSSMSGSTLIVSSNEKFNNYYPLTTPDYLEEIMWERYKNQINNISKDELDVNNFFIKKSLNYIYENKLDYFISIFKKLELIFFNIKKDGQPIGHPDYNSIRVSTIFNKIFFISTLLIIINNISKRRTKEEDKIFCIIFFSYIFPYIIGWVYERHMIPMYLISHLYIFFYLKDKYKNYFN